MIEQRDCHVVDRKVPFRETFMDFAGRFVCDSAMVYLHTRYSEVKHEMIKV